jgi:pimeloyl-ACP methyl ester carboxylesterase
MRNFSSRVAQTAFVASVIMICAGCGATRAWLPQARSAAKPPATGAPSNVVVVRATARYWPDCDRLVQNLEEQGAPAMVIRGMEVNRTADRIVAARRSGDVRPLVLIGYSRGANDALRLTRRLQKENIAVDTLVLMEMAAQESVPANVVSCLNVYKSSPADDWVPAFRGLPVTVESAQTNLVNYNVRFHDEAVAQAAINQFTVSQNPAVQAMVVERVTMALRPVESASETTDTQLAGRIGDWRDRRVHE